MPFSDPVWDEWQSKQLLADWNIPVVEEALTKDQAQALAFAEKAGYPLALKGLLPGEVHKTEKGLVTLNISNQAQLSAAWEDMNARLEGQGRVLVQKQIKGDYELIAGFMRDPQFGPCVMFGLGGIMAELSPDVAFALAPLTQEQAVRLMERIKARRLWKGFRGLPPLDQDAMARLLVGLGDLACAFPRIRQIDVNPVMVSQGRPWAVGRHRDIG